MRLIDADYLKRMFDVACGTNREVFNIADSVYNFAIKTIDDAPTVCNDNYAMGYQDGVKKVLSERPQGEWGKPFLHSDGRWYHKCTNCHICSEVSILQDKYCNFCVNCGAYMMKEAENNES